MSVSAWPKEMCMKYVDSSILLVLVCSRRGAAYQFDEMSSMCFCQNENVEPSTSSGCMSKPTPPKKYAPQEQGLENERFMKYYLGAGFK